jgi:hypothetical protein
MNKFNRKLFAPVAYLFSFILISSVVLENIHWIDNPYISFEQSFFSRTKIFSWGNHNFVFAVTIIIASFLSGVITGAIVEKKNSIISPVCFLIIITYIIYSENNFVSNNIFSIIISVIASVYFSFLGSNAGVEIENLFAKKDNNTLLGIISFHWIWILFPLSFTPMYLWGVAFVHTLLRFLSLWQSSEDFFIRVASLICIVPIIFWAFIPICIYRILAGIDFYDKKNLYKSGLIVLILVFGGGFALLIQLVSYFIIENFLLQKV